MQSFSAFVPYLLLQLLWIHSFINLLLIGVDNQSKNLVTSPAVYITVEFITNWPQELLTVFLFTSVGKFIHLGWKVKQWQLLFNNTALQHCSSYAPIHTGYRTDVTNSDYHWKRVKLQNQEPDYGNLINILSMTLVSFAPDINITCSFI